MAACLIFAAPPLLLTFTSPEFKAIMLDPNSVTGKFRQMDFSVVSITLLLVTAILKTAFAEEIFFRGFVAKRLISAAGFLKGNLIQATLFGLIHAGIFAMTTDNLLFLFIIYLAPAMGAYVSVYLNEKVGNGSITPGWISHSLANVLSYTIVGFVI
ncbi:MAG: CPBP family intramembrane glutamic endopeptidase [Cyclobacteriaceae bacterium]